MYNQFIKLGRKSALLSLLFAIAIFTAVSAAAIADDAAGGKLCEAGSAAESAAAETEAAPIATPTVAPEAADAAKVAPADGSEKPAASDNAGDNASDKKLTESERIAKAMAALSPELRKLLEEVSAAGKKYRTISADVIYREEETVFGERSTYSGKVYYDKPADKDKSGRFRIHFDELTAGGRRSDEDRDYCFYSDRNGQWFVTRNAKIKQIVKHHVARAGENSDPLALGRGPFPVPFGQDTDRVVQMFDLSTRDFKKGDPKNSRYVKLMPHEDTAEQLRVKLIEMWFDDRGLPVKIAVEDIDGEVRKMALFRKIDTESKLTDETFILPWPSVTSGWQRRIEPLPEAPAKSNQ